MEILIRQALSTDYEHVLEVLRKAFAQEQESLLVQKLIARPEFVPELSLVVEADKEIIGHLLFTPVKIQTDDAFYRSLSLAPVSVLPTFQKKGVGKKLIKSGLKICKDMGYGSVIVLGHPEYYPQFGFRPAGIWGIKAPFEVPYEAFMAIELKAHELEGKAGLVIYPKEFFE